MLVVEYDAVTVSKKDAKNQHEHEIGAEVRFRSAPSNNLSFDDVEPRGLIIISPFCEYECIVGDHLNPR